MSDAHARRIELLPEGEFYSHSPGPELAPFVEAIWGVRGIGSHHAESVLPNGLVELMVNFGQRQKVVGYGERTADDSFGRSWIAGIQNQRLVHTAQYGTDLISARFRPGGAHAFFDLPMDELTNQVVELDALVGLAAGRLRDRLGEVSNDRDRCRLFETWLLGRRRAVHPYFATIRRATDLLRGSRFRLSVAGLCEEIGLSNRYLGRQFRALVGLPPKQFARVQRFHAVIGSCSGQTRIEWSRLAHEFGYSDQAHLIREFRRLGSLTPGEFLARRTPDETGVIVD